ncbi:MAG: glycosyltransferase [Actinomycetota bacterium]
MSAQLRVVLDQLTQVVDADQAAASLSLTEGLIRTAPPSCRVEAIVPAGRRPDIPGLSAVRQLPLARRELAGSWQLGLAPGVGGGLMHAPTLMAPLVRHDRLHDDDQIAVTVWDLDAWEAPETLSKTTVGWQRAMMKRAAKHADIVIVPSHSVAERIADVAKVGDRVRVVAGAAPECFGAPADAGDRRVALSLPEEYIVLAGTEASVENGFRAAAAAGVDAVVLDAAEGAEPRLADLAAAAGLPERQAHIRGRLDESDRAAVLEGARAFIATSGRTAWPWRAVEAMHLGIPVLAVDSGVHRDVIAEGGLLVTADELPEAIEEALEHGARRLRVLAADRARAFSWASSAERIWSLHADL